jgi:hypothetical protein
MLLTALTPQLLPQGAARAEAEAKAQPLAPRRQLPPRARASIKAARMKAVKEPKVCTRRRCPDPVNSISPLCPFIRPIRLVQAAGSKRGREGDEEDMSTEDNLEVVVKKTPATKKRCATKFRQNYIRCASLNLDKFRYI